MTTRLHKVEISYCIHKIYTKPAFKTSAKRSENRQERWKRLSTYGLKQDKMGNIACIMILQHLIKQWLLAKYPTPKPFLVDLWISAQSARGHD